MSPMMFPMQHTLAAKGRLWSTSLESLFKPYLLQHPARVADLFHCVPEVRNGLLLHWSADERGLFLERMEVVGLKDPLVEMALWHALFPGLKHPLKAFWTSGTIAVSEIRPWTMDPDLRKDFMLGSASLFLEMDRGKVRLSRSPSVKPPRLRDVDPWEWPLLYRVLLAPLIVLLAPLGVVLMVFEGPRSKSATPRWFLLLIPFFTMMLLLKLLFPRSFDRYLEPFVDGIGIGFRQRRAVEELVNEALEREVPRQDRV